MYIVWNFVFVYFVFVEWCCEWGLFFNLLIMIFEFLDNVFRRFYVEVRIKKGEEYSRLIFFGIWNVFERYFVVNGRKVKIMKNFLFVKFNKMFECKLKLNCREGKENVKYKFVI